MLPHQQLDREHRRATGAACIQRDAGRVEADTRRARDPAGGMFDIDQAKSEAGVRKFPIHSDLQPIIARLKRGWGADDLLIRASGKDAANAFGKRFGSYRAACGVVDVAVGRRQERVDFHSLRRWFVTEARKGFDRAVVAAIVGHEPEI